MRKLFYLFLFTFFSALITDRPLDAAKKTSKKLSLSYWHEEGTSVMDFIKPIAVDEEPSGLAGTDCIYLINLDRRPLRLERMTHIFNDYGLHFQRVSAVDGQQLSMETKECLFGDYPIHLPNGAIGCLLSHLSILQDAYSRNYKCVWVLEDDVLVQENPHVLSSLLKKLEKEDPKWDIFFTDRDAKDHHGNYFIAQTSDFRPDQHGKKIAYYQKKEKVGPFFRVRQRYGAWSLFVSRRGIEKLLNYYQHVYLWGAYDVDLFYTPNLRCYTTDRDIVTQWLEGQYSDTSQ